MQSETKPKLVPEVDETAAPEPEALSIAKPITSALDKFKSKRAATIANVETLLTALPVQKISAARDFVRLHPDKAAYQSVELCFVNVTIKGQTRDTLHLIDEGIAMANLPSDIIRRFSLALASKPDDKFFLCEVPTRNIGNSWVDSNLAGCELARERWSMVTSRKSEGVEAYKTEFARSEKAFPEPNWPSQSLDELILVTFKGRMIDRDDHPALLRLVGAEQSLK
jgi:hypothetical protein